MSVQTGHKKRELIIIEAMQQAGLEVDALNDRNRRFEVPNPARELVLMYYRKPTEGDTWKYVTSTQVVARFSFSVRLNNIQVGRAFQELGYEQVRTRNGRFWIVAERSANEINTMLPESVTDVTDTFLNNTRN